MTFIKSSYPSIPQRTAVKQRSTCNKNLCFVSCSFHNSNKRVLLLWGMQSIILYSIKWVWGQRSFCQPRGKNCCPRATVLLEGLTNDRFPNYTFDNYFITSIKLINFKVIAELTTLLLSVLRYFSVICDVKTLKWPWRGRQRGGRQFGSRYFRSRLSFWLWHQTFGLTVVLSSKLYIEINHI